MVEGFSVCWAAFVSLDCRIFLEEIRNIATVAAAAGAIAIPFVLWFGTARRERRRATVDLITTLATAPEVVDRLERLYKYRRYEDTQGTQSTSPNPYIDWPDGLLFDSVIVLNYYESACAAITAGLVNEKVLMESSDAMIRGMKDVILARYARITGIDVEKHHQNIITVAARWQAKRPDASLSKIPNPRPVAQKSN